MAAIKWILVADDSGARLFKTLGRSPQLTLIQEFDHPEAHQRNRDFDTDRPGRSFDSIGRGRHAMSAEVNPKQREEERFAHELGRYLKEGHDHQTFSELVLVASPRLLGDLRQILPDNVKKCIIEEIDKDYPKTLSVHDVIARLQKELFSLQSGL